MNTIGTVKDIPSGKGSDFEWKIPNFSSVAVSNERCFWSPPFSFAGASWCFEIFPNGAPETKSNGYISLIKPTFNRLICLKCALGFKTVHGTIKWGHTGYFETFKESFGNPICQLPLVPFENRTEWLPGDVLTVFGHLELLEPSATPIGASATAECPYCKKNFDAGSVTCHEKKCLDRPIKCPECADVVLLQNWLDHECPAASAKGDPHAWKYPNRPETRKILQDFKQLFLKQENCDVVVKVQEREFLAHRAILAARSPVFASMFQNDMKEKSTGIVNVEGCNPATFPAFLCYLYCENTGSLSSANVFDIFTAADKYQVPDLKAKCLEFIQENFSVDTFCDSIALALLHGERDLIHSATAFFVQNAEEILKTVKWQSFAAENPTQSNELFIKFVESVKRQNK